MESWEDGQDEEESSDEQRAVIDPYRVVPEVQEQDAVAATTQERPEVLWEAFTSPQGAPYYHNSATGESRWQLPTGPFDVVVPAGTVEARKRARIEEQENVVSEPKAKLAKSRRRRAAADGAEAAHEAGPKGATSSSSSTSGGSDSGSASESSSNSKERQAKIDGFKQLQAKLADFRNLLQERRIKPFDKYLAWAPRLAGDPRFLAVPVDIRKQLFTREVQRLAEGRRQTSAAARRENCEGLSQLLAQAREKDLFKGAQDVPAALKALEGTEFGNDKRWLCTAPSDRERLVVKIVEEELRRQGKEELEAAKAFRALLQEKILHQPTDVEDVVEPLPWASVNRTQSLLADPRYGAVGSDSARKRIYMEAAAEYSRKMLAVCKRHVNDEMELVIVRDQGSVSAAETAFRSLLAQQVKAPLQVSWHEVCVLLANQPMPVGLDEAGRERIFNEVCREEGQRGAKKFLQALEKAPAEIVAPHHEFSEICEVLLRQTASLQPFLGNGPPPSELRDAWEAWRRQVLERATIDFQSWLPRCPHLSVTASDADARRGRGQAFEDLCTKLAEEPAWRRLAAAPVRRRKILAEHLGEVAARQAKSVGRSAAVLAGEE